MIKDIGTEVQERYLSPYKTGVGIPAILPRVDVENTSYKLTPKTASSILGGELRWGVCYEYPEAASDYSGGRIFNPRSNPTGKTNIVLRVDGKWLTNRGNPTDKFSVMSLTKARELVKGRYCFEYAIIRWRFDVLPTFLLRDDTISLFSVEDLLSYINTRHVVVANLIKSMVNK